MRPGKWWPGRRVHRGVLHPRSGVAAGRQSLIACSGSKTVSIAIQTPPADFPCSSAGTVCVEINSISADGTRGVAVAIFVCGYALVADCPHGAAVAVAISAHVLTADPACRISVPISVGVYGAIAVNACRITRLIRVKGAALGVQRKNGCRQHQRCKNEARHRMLHQPIESAEKA